MIEFEVHADPVRINNKPLRQFITCEWEGALCIFTSVTNARRWAEDVVFQRHSGLPPVTAGLEGGWRSWESSSGEDD